MRDSDAILQGDVNEAHNGEAKKANVKNRLKSAMKRADKHIGTSEELNKQTQDEYLEEQLAEYLADELDLDKKDVTGKDDVSDNKDDSPTANYAAGSSAKVMEIQDKQAMLQSMTHKIRENCEALSSVSKQAEQMIAYLERSESELIRLEENDFKLAQLNKASINLAQKHKKAKLTLAGQQKNISLLESQNKAVHEMLESAKLDLASLEDENTSLTLKLTEKDMVSEKLLNEKQSQAEKIDLLIDEQEAKVSELHKTNKLLNASQQKNREFELLVAKYERTITELTAQGDKRLADINDLGVRYDRIRDRLVEKEAELEKVKQEGATARKELEEKLRLKLQRCQELESKMVISEKQLALTEERVTAITFELDTIKRINSRNSNDPASSRAKKRTRPIDEDSRATAA